MYRVRARNIGSSENVISVIMVCVCRRRSWCRDGDGGCYDANMSRVLSDCMWPDFIFSLSSCHPFPTYLINARPTGFESQHACCYYISSIPANLTFHVFFIFWFHLKHPGQQEYSCVCLQCTTYMYINYVQCRNKKCTNPKTRVCYDCRTCFNSWWLKIYTIKQQISRSNLLYDLQKVLIGTYFDYSDSKAIVHCKLYATVRSACGSKDQGV
jgi:hypothetical protein